MIPTTNKVLTTSLKVAQQPSLQNKMDIDRNRIAGTVDNRDAVQQTVYKILNTERYAYLIYSWDYGIELADLFGKPVMYVCPELERRIREALQQDDRITSVDSFEFDTSKKRTVKTTFIVHTIFGDLDEELKVMI